MGGKIEMAFGFPVFLDTLPQSSSLSLSSFSPASIMETKPKRVRDDEANDFQENDHLHKSGNIRSQYREIECRMKDERDDIADANSKKFMLVMSQVEDLHQYVQRPREQVADAEALLGLSNTLVASVKTHMGSGITPAQFVSSLIGEFGKQKGLCGGSPSILWKNIGSVIVPLFMNVQECKTMIGPLSNELKARQQLAARLSTQEPLSRPRRTRSRATRVARAHPKELQKNVEVVTDTDINVCIMFELLKKKKEVQVENLILNRSSFAQTIENLFALSFLVKDGRVIINVDNNGSQVVVPSNGPCAEEIKSGAVRSHHFIFRCDFEDWKAMKDLVQEGKEVMPTRHAYTENVTAAKDCSEDDGIPIAIPVDRTMKAAPVRKFSRNHGYYVVAK